MMLNSNSFYEQCSLLNINKDIYVGFSGGIDSSVLTYLVYKTFYMHENEKYKITAVHINHNLNPNARKWEKFCKEFCNSLNISFKSYCVDATPNKDQSPEDAARCARQKIWHELLNKKATLLLAHHQNDQAETVLYRLIRGAGPKGLAGISSKINFNQGNIIRPLLNFRKEDILNYAKTNKLSWIEDDSNLNENFDRNFIRHKVLPLLESRWSKVTNNISNAAYLCSMNNEYIEENIKILFVECYKPKTKTLSISKLLSLSKFLRYKVIRYFINTRDNSNVMPSLKQIKCIVNEVMNAKQDAKPVLKIANYYVTRYRDDLYFLQNDPKQFDEIQLEVKISIKDFLYNINSNANSKINFVVKCSKNFKANSNENPNINFVVKFNANYNNMNFNTNLNKDSNLYYNEDFKKDFNIRYKCAESLEQNCFVKMLNSKKLIINKTNKIGMGIAEKHLLNYNQDFIQDNIKQKKSENLNIVIKMGEHGAKLKKIFQQFGIAPWERRLHPIIYVENQSLRKLEAIAIVGVWYNPKYKANPKENSIEFIYE